MPLIVVYIPTIYAPTGPRGLAPRERLGPALEALELALIKEPPGTIGRIISGGYYQYHQPEPEPTESKPKP